MFKKKAVEPKVLAQDFQAVKIQFVEEVVERILKNKLFDKLRKPFTRLNLVFKFTIRINLNL